MDRLTYIGTQTQAGQTDIHWNTDTGWTDRQTLEHRNRLDRLTYIGTQTQAGQTDRHWDTDTGWTD